MNRLDKTIAALLAATVSTFAQAAASVSPVAYDMPNGSGQVNGGQFNYWDREYNGSGAVTTDGAFLSGGLGNLTDGVTTNLNWFAIENNDGTGPYVGWRSTITPNPTVLFRFGGLVALNSITVHMDDADGAGGVQTPLSIDISTNGTTFASNPLVDPIGTAPFAHTIQLGGISTDHLYVRFTNRDQWVFIDEVSFSGQPVPEPHEWAMMMAGLGIVAWGARRRR